VISGPAARAAFANPSVQLAGLAVFISMGFQILLPVVPVLVERDGPHGAAGAATAALFMGAVAGELATPWLMSKLRSRHVLVCAQLLSALASLVYTLPEPGSVAMISAATLRGSGLGLSIAISVAVLSELTPPHRRGATIGYYGLALSGPGIVVPSIGVLLLASRHVEVAALIACASGIVGALVALRIPDRPIHLVEGSTTLVHAMRRPGLLAVAAGFVLVSFSFGGVFTYAPISLPLAGLGSAATFLLVSGAARTIGRWLGGYLGDRRPGRAVLIGSVAAVVCGLVALALHGHNPAAVVVAAMLFGGGYGATQTAAFLAMSESGTISDAGPISALWNGGIDLGSSLGGTLVGLVAAGYGYGTAAWFLPCVVILSMPLFLLRFGPVSSTADAAI
jgi:predicted MFS family arabinose efflux permease